MLNIKLMDHDDVKLHMEDIYRLLLKVLEENMQQPIPEELPKKYTQDLETYILDGSAILIGAYDNECLIGLHWAYETMNINERRVHSNFNIIDPKYRGKKIGSEMLRQLEEECKNRDIYIIEAMCTYANKGAVNYHLKNGFEIERLKVKKELSNDR